MMRSLHSRMLMVASLVLASFLGLSALALDQAFRKSMEEAVRERLQDQIYALLGAAGEDSRGRMRLPEALPDPRLSNPDSGLYAQVEGEKGSYSWKSFSLVGRNMEFLNPQPAGQLSFERSRFEDGEYYVIAFGVLWEDFSGGEWDYTLSIAQSTRGITAQVEAFRARLFYWLGGVALLLLVTQGLVLGWGLRPLRKAEADLHRIETGKAERIDGRYPRELQGLIDKINLLLRNSKTSRDRYRHSLGDLAHSLKTPLSVLKGASGSTDRERLGQIVDEEVSRMDDIVQYQLKRAAASGVSHPGISVPVRPIAQRLMDALVKVYGDGETSCRIEIDGAVTFPGDGGDLMEILGNLMDNAFKYGYRNVRVGASWQTDSNAGIVKRLRISVEDDGPGVPEADREEILNRGVRRDQRIPGQGIGLSVTREIVSLYGGSLSIQDSDLGGTAVIVTL
ncbi:MAG: histidine kinase [Gammaproteobacteria bacterium]|nr:histidine kinase [Gammaproteobacteria bacterium]